MEINRSIRVTAWIGVFLGVFMASLPLAAIAQEFKAPKRGIPGRRLGGGTRNPFACVQGNPSYLTALLPQTNLGLTTSPYPRFFWFLPKNNATQVEFTLHEGTEETPNRTLIYKTTFAASGTPGIASLTLPSDAGIPPLQVGKDYHWSVTLICNPEQPQSSLNVDGWVQRVAVEPGLQNQLARATPRDRVSLYAQNGLWFDTLTTLAELSCARPNNPEVTKSWATVLKSVKLDAIAGQPLLQSCGGGSR